MNFRKYLLTTVVLFVFIFLYELMLHGFILLDLYQSTATVWRDFADMDPTLPSTICFKFALAAWTAFAFSQIYKEGGIKSGLLFGLIFGVFAGILTAQWYLWLKVPAMLSLSWFIGSVVEGLGAGLIAGAIYRK